jgi:hypothetical protein
MQHRRYPHAYLQATDSQRRNGHASTFVGRILVMDDGFRSVHRHDANPRSRQGTQARLIGPD